MCDIELSLITVPAIVLTGSAGALLSSTVPFLAATFCAAPQSQKHTLSHFN
jgi:hypothetical protein